MEYEGKNINFKWNITIRPAAGVAGALYSSFSYMYDGIYKDPLNANLPIKKLNVEIECGDLGMLFIAECGKDFSYYKDNQYIFNLSERLLKLNKTA